MGSIINSGISWLKNMVAGVIDLLPDSPFNFDIPDYVQDILGYITFFVLIGGMIKILTAWSALFVVWYSASVLMRWIKAIE